jgi:hypothetical protein
MRKTTRKMKKDLKELVVKIRNGKSGRKPKNRTDFNIVDYEDLSYHRRQFRHLHIAYCLMRGRRIEQIEPNTRDYNKHNISQVDKYISQYTPKPPVIPIIEQLELILEAA